MTNLNKHPKPFRQLIGRSKAGAAGWTGGAYAGARGDGLWLAGDPYAAGETRVASTSISFTRRGNGMPDKSKAGRKDGGVLF
jgi:hypothetical protein